MVGSFPAVELGELILRLLPMTMIQPPYAFFFWGVVAFIFFQHWRTAKLEEKIYGQVLNSPLEATLSASVYGVIGGLLVSVAFVGLGVTLEPTDIAYVWPLALAFILLEPRLICFAYAGGLVALSALLFGWPQINVAGLMALVALLHLVEGLLTYLGGDQAASPMYLERENGETVGGFSISRFWPIPVAIVFLVTAPELSVGAGIDMPDWWPLIPAEGAAGLDPEEVTYLLAPVPAALGYGDFALSEPPAVRSRKGARSLTFYSLILLGLSLAAVHVPVFAWAAALFSPVGHEYMAEGSALTQMGGEPMYRAPEDGVMILDVLPDSPAEELELKSGDIIRRVNGEPVASAAGLNRALVAGSFFLELDYERDGSADTAVLRRFSGKRSLRRLGVIPVPGPDAEPHARLQPGGHLSRALQWVKDVVTGADVGDGDGGGGIGGDGTEGSGATGRDRPDGDEGSSSDSSERRDA